MTEYNEKRGSYDANNDKPCVIWTHQSYRNGGHDKTTKALRKIGWEVCVCNTTAESMRKMRNHKAQVVITDMLRVERGFVNLVFAPKAGLDLLKRVRNENGSICLIVYCKQLSQATIQDCFDCGASMVITEDGQLLSFMRHFYTSQSWVKDNDTGRMNLLQRMFKLPNEMDYRSKPVDPSHADFKRIQESIEGGIVADQKASIVCIDAITNSKQRRLFLTRLAQLKDYQTFNLLYAPIVHSDIVRQEIITKGIKAPVRRHKKQERVTPVGMYFATKPIAALKSEKWASGSFVSLLVFTVATGLHVPLDQVTTLSSSNVLHTYDSVFIEGGRSTSKAMYDEYIIFHPRQAIPAYLVTVELTDIETLSSHSRQTSSSGLQVSVDGDATPLPALNWAELSVDESAKLGTGAFGSVYKGSWRGVVVAVKKLHGVSADAIELLKLESSLMHKLGNHPHIIRLCGICYEPLAIVTPFYPKGSVSDLLLVHKSDIAWERLVQIAANAAAGVLHLHLEKVVHRDIAGRNVLVNNDWHGIVCDFGLATVMTGDYVRTSGPSPIKWMAPEAIREKKFSMKSDSYSFGIFLWELVARSSPYPGLEVYEIPFRVVRENLRPEIPEGCCPTFKELMIQCWDADPEKRPDFKHIHSTLNKLAISLRTEAPPVATFDKLVTNSSTDAYYE